MTTRTLPDWSFPLSFCERFSSIFLLISFDFLFYLIYVFLEMRNYLLHFINITYVLLCDSHGNVKLSKQNARTLQSALGSIIVILNPSVGTKGRELYDAIIKNKKIPKSDWFKKQCNLQAALVQLQKHFPHQALVTLFCFEI